MKEQEDIKQDFDHWLRDQWREAYFVPSSQDRKKLTKKLRYRKKKQRWTLTLILCLSIIVFYIGFFKQSSHLEKNKSKQPREQIKPIQIYGSAENDVHMKEIKSLVPLKSLLKNGVVPIVVEPIENTDIEDLPTDEDRNYTLETYSPVLENQLDLDTVMKCLGIFYLQSSLSKDRTKFAGITSGHELVIARSMYGSYSLPTSPDTLSMEGGFRPIGMSDNQYVQFAFYDVKQLLFNEAIYRQIVAINVLPKVAYFMKSNRQGWHNLVNTDMNINVDQRVNPAAQNQFQNMNRIAQQDELKNQMSLLKPGREMYVRKGMRVNYKAKIGLLINDNFAIYSQPNKVLIVSCDAERVSLVTENGYIEASHAIDVQKPRFFSQKARYTLYDYETERLYLIIETNFAYIWYEVNQQTGNTRYIFKTETIWNQPNWLIENGMLKFTFKGKKYVQSLN